jgi:hypothetical protein
MLKKANYNAEHVTKADETPRLLIIRVWDKTNQYIVRYPDGQAERVNADWLRVNSIYEPDHPSYRAVADKMPAFEYEFRRSETFKDYLYNVQPALAQDLQQLIEAKNRAKYEANKPEPFRPQIPQEIREQLPEQPVPFAVLSSEQPEEILSMVVQITLLKSIDASLKKLVELWGGQSK